MRHLVFQAILVFGLASPAPAFDFQATTSPSDRPVPEHTTHDYITYRAEPQLDMIQQSAQFKAQQRRLRLETMRWYGVSNARPMANSTNRSIQTPPSYGYPLAPFYFGSPIAGRSMAIQIR